MAFRHFASNGLRALKVAALTALSLMAGYVAAEPAESNLYEMLVISNEAFGEQLLDGQHATTIESISSSPIRIDRFSASNNLCVAYVRAKQVNKALAACKKAVNRSRLKNRRDQAIALSNLGVVRALKGDTDGARHSFKAALRLYPALAIPSENLARLLTKSELSIASL